jgi:polyisoprenoid-binding protein YceI
MNGSRTGRCMPDPMLKREVCGADAEEDLNWSEYGMKMSQSGGGDAGKVHLSRSKRSETNELDR